MFEGLDTEKYDRQYSDRLLVSRMWSYFRVHARKLALVGLLLVLMAGVGAAQPWIVARGVDMLKGKLSAGNIALISGVVLAAGSIFWAANWLRRRLSVEVVGDTVMDLRVEAFQAALNHDLSFYDEYASGKIVSRISSDSYDFGQVILLVSDLVSDFLQAIILGAALVAIDWRLSLYLLGCLPVLFIAALSFRRLARTVTRRGMRAMANVNAAIKETVSGIAVAKNFRQEAAIYATFDEANRLSYRVNVQRGFVLSLVFPALNALGGAATALLVYTGGLSAAAGIVSIGTWFLFLQSLDRFFFPVLNLSSFWAQVQSGLSAAERIFALIDAEPAVVQVGQKRIERLRGEVHFERVTFRYKRDKPILEDFSLHIRPGETIALVGHTGAGKSSIARLIARFYEFQSGRLLIDGEDIRSFHLGDYRRRLGIVAQTPFLFSGSVMENICYTCSEQANPEKVIELAYRIGEGEWLEALPEGLETQVGERGARLSMGQRQLVALMRVLVQNPSIFILDEATASIDPFTEWQIQQALNLILANATSILIAHRLSTVKAADRIIVLESGKIIEEGDHTSLLERGGHYASLYNTYFRHQSVDYRPEGMERGEWRRHSGTDFSAER